MNPISMAKVPRSGNIHWLSRKCGDYLRIPQVQSKVSPLVPMLPSISFFNTNSCYCLQRSHCLVWEPARRGKAGWAVPGCSREQSPESLRAQCTFGTDSRLLLQDAHIFSFGLRYKGTRRKSTKQRLML